MQITEKNMETQLIRNIVQHAMQTQFCLRIIQNNVLFLSQHESDLGIDFPHSIDELHAISVELDFFVEAWLEIREEQL